MYSFRKHLPFYRRNLRVALPVMVTQAGQVAVQLADNIMVGHVGTSQLAGVSFANAIFLIGLVTLIGFAQGLTPMVGEAFAKGRREDASRYLRNSLSLNIAVYLLAGLALLSAGLCMGRMGQDAEVLEHARKYFFINVFSVIPLSVFFTSRFFAEGLGDTRYAMWITVMSNLVNVGLNWVLIFGHMGFPAMGVAGAAAATLASRTLSAAVFVCVLLYGRAFREYSRTALRMKSDAATVRSLLRISVPVAFSGMLESTAFNFAAVMVGWMGAVQLAAHQIVNSLGQLSFMIACGIGAAATIRVSHQFGAGRHEETLMAGRASVHMALLYMCTCGLVFFLFRNLLPYAYTSDPEVAGLASELIVILCLYQVFDAVQLTSMASLRGLKDTKRPMWYAAVSYYGIAIPSGYLIGFVNGAGPEGVWCGLLLGLSVAAVLLYVRFRRICHAMV